MTVPMYMLKATTPLKSIKTYCVVMCSPYPMECDAEEWCPLWKYRNGNVPMSQEQRDALSARGLRRTESKFFGKQYELPFKKEGDKNE